MNFLNLESLIKIGLSIMLLLCLLDMPYGYYQLVRFVALIGFSILAYHANQKEEQTSQVIFIILAILFQPFFKIALGRTLWNIVDVIVALGLMFSLISNKKNIK